MKRFFPTYCLHLCFFFRFIREWLVLLPFATPKDPRFLPPCVFSSIATPEEVLVSGTFSCPKVVDVLLPASLLPGDSLLALSVPECLRLRCVAFPPVVTYPSCFSIPLRVFVQINQPFVFMVVFTAPLCLSPNLSLCRFILPAIHPASVLKAFIFF